MKKKNITTSVIVLIIAIAGIFLISQGGASNYPHLKNSTFEMNIYKSSSCGCCGIYGNIFESKGNSNVKIIDTKNLNSLKEKNSIPNSLTSCHTTIVGDYFVEGHIPLEAIEKLLKEKPDILGIAMPGMPSGSPGMPGSKSGDFVIYQVNNDLSVEEFMRI